MEAVGCWVASAARAAEEEAKVTEVGSRAEAVPVAVAMVLAGLAMVARVAVMAANLVSVVMVALQVALAADWRVAARMDGRVVAGG